ncbi:Solute carrier family 45 member 3 [Chionoecetes opilio]|uniref:Solute carrier family 45 member 3 n=1 Tax=Chionoecetes opilio TaxID=41210 RepID=A0A8J4YUS0_CHIOP|nr:Solute carrier family 45 member 3 [Chionoecetes opilio]
MDLSATPLHHDTLQEETAVSLLESGGSRGMEGDSGVIARSRRRGGRVRGLPGLLAVNALVCGVEIVSSAAFTFIPPLLLKAGYSETLMTIILGIGGPFIMFLSTLLLLSLILIPYGPTTPQSPGKIPSPDKRERPLETIEYFLLPPARWQHAQRSYCLHLGTRHSRFTWTDSVSPLTPTASGAGTSLETIEHFLLPPARWQHAQRTVHSRLSGTDGVLCDLRLIPSVSLPDAVLCPGEALHAVPHRQGVQPREAVQGLAKDYVKGRGSGQGGKEAAVLDLTRDKPALVRDHPSDGGYESGSSDTDDSKPLVLPASEMLRWRYQRLVHQLSRLPQLTVQRVVVKLVKLLGRLVVGVLYLPYQVALLPLDTWRRITTAPTVLRRLFLCELFGWMGFMCHNMFFTDFVGQHMYGGLPDAPEHTRGATLYDEGVRMGSWGLFLHSLTACLYAFFVQQHMVHLVGHRTVFLGGLVIFTLTMAVTIVVPSVAFLNAVTALSGIGFAALTSTPNMLVTLYNSDRQLYMWDELSPDGGEERGLGTDVAVLDTAYFLSQIILSVCMGPLVDLTGSALPYMVVAALSGLVAVYYGARIVFTDVHLRQTRLGLF